MKKVFAVEDLDCAACAAKIENALREMEGISDVSVSYLAQKMTVEYDDGADIVKITKQIVKKCKKIEPDMLIIT